MSKSIHIKPTYVSSPSYPKTKDRLAYKVALGTVALLI
jgi:hypothetical protein